MVNIALSLLRERRLSDDLFFQALAELGPERLVETVGLVSHYNMISSVANVFDLEVPEGTKTSEAEKIEYPRSRCTLSS